jgi:hypothetical protein
MRRVLLAFLAGFLATLIFHQPVLALLHTMGMTPRGAYPMQGVPPFGVPAVISLSFWGGVWGAIMIPIIDRLRGGRFWVAAIVFGAILPTLVAWFVVTPLKGGSVPRAPKAMMIGPIVNAAWGLGTAVFYTLFARRRR